MRRRRGRGRAKGTKPAGSALLGTNPDAHHRLRLTDDDRQLLVALLDQALPYPHDDRRWWSMPYKQQEKLRPLQTLRARLVDPRPGTNRRRRW